MRVLLLGLLLICSTAYAGNREEKIQTLMEAQGLLKTFEQQLEIGHKQASVQGKQMYDQMMSQMDPGEKFKKRFKVAYNKFLKSLETPWTAKEIVAVWARYYGPKFTDEELDQLIKYYKSDLGQKEVAASREAFVQFNDHFVKEGQPVMQKAVENYVNDLKQIANECNCVRKKG